VEDIQPIEFHPQGRAIVSLIPIRPCWIRWVLRLVITVNFWFAIAVASVGSRATCSSTVLELPGDRPACKGTTQTLDVLSHQVIQRSAARWEALLRLNCHAEPLWHCSVIDPQIAGARRFAFIRCFGSAITVSPLRQDGFDEPFGPSVGLPAGCRAWCGMGLRYPRRDRLFARSQREEGRCLRGFRRQVSPAFREPADGTGQESNGLSPSAHQEHLRRRPGVGVRRFATCTSS